MNLRGRAANYNLILPQVADRMKEDFGLVILDPVYKLYGLTDENKASDVARLLNAIEDLAVTTRAGAAFGSHFSKGNQSQKESIDRISGSGVFARDPDSILTFTRHENEDCFIVEPTLRAFKPVPPFVVRWQYPVMVPESELDPAKLKRVQGRKLENSPNDLLELLPETGLENPGWLTLAEKNGISKRTFWRLRKALENEGKIHSETISGKWKPILTK